MKPSEINALHQKAMEFATEAESCYLVGDQSKAEAGFSRAFELERRAAEAVANIPDSEPSRSILLRSAASLALDCRKFREAERLIALALSGDPPSEICEELRDLLESVYFGRHLDLRGLELDPTELQMTMVGSAVGFGIMESNQFLKRVQHLDKLVVRTAERKLGQPFRESGMAQTKSKPEFHVYLSVPRPASYAVTVRLGRPKRQRNLGFPDELKPESVVTEVLDCLAEFGGEEVDKLRERIPDPAYFNNFTALAKKISPDGDKVKTVGFTTTKGGVQQTIALKNPPSDIWQPKTEVGKQIEYIGRVRSADEAGKNAEHPVFCVVDDAGTISPRIRVRSGELQDIVKPYWGEQVRVKVSLSKSGPPVMIDISPVSEESP